MDNQTISDVFGYVVNHIPSILNYSIDGVTIALVMQWFAHRFKFDQVRVKVLGFIKLDGPKLATIILTIGTALVTCVDWLIDPQNAAYIPHEFAFILTAALYIHRFLVDPAVVKFITWARPYLQAIRLVNSTSGYNEQVQPQVLPQQLQPVYVPTPTPPTQQITTPQAPVSVTSQDPGPTAPPSNP